MPPNNCRLRRSAKSAIVDPVPKKLPTSFRLTKDAQDLLEKLAEYEGTSRTSMLEILIRQRARHLLPKEDRATS